MVDCRLDAARGTFNAELHSGSPKKVHRSVFRWTGNFQHRSFRWFVFFESAFDLLFKSCLATCFSPFELFLEGADSDESTGLSPSRPVPWTKKLRCSFSPRPRTAMLKTAMQENEKLRCRKNLGPRKKLHRSFFGAAPVQPSFESSSSGIQPAIYHSARRAIRLRGWIRS